MWYSFAMSSTFDDIMKCYQLGIIPATYVFNCTLTIPSNKSKDLLISYYKDTWGTETTLTYSQKIDWKVNMHYASVGIAVLLLTHVNL